MTAAKALAGVVVRFIPFDESNVEWARLSTVMLQDDAQQPQALKSSLALEASWGGLLSWRA